MGLRVVCVDSRQAPLDLVKSLKFEPVYIIKAEFISLSYSLIRALQDYAIDATKGIEYALAEFKGHDVDAVIMCTDSVPAYEYGLQMVRKHGTYVVVGQ